MTNSCVNEVIQNNSVQRTLVVVSDGHISQGEEGPRG